MKRKIRRHDRFYSIDPGLGGTGWAEWRTGPHQPTQVGVLYIRTGTGDGLAERCEDLSSRIVNIIEDGGGCVPLVNVILEMPQHMVNIKGIAAQAGSVYKLTFLVGYLAKAVYPCTVHVVTPSEWKGQLPKDVVERRITNQLGAATCIGLNIRSHAWDAVGIGLWSNGLWPGK